MLEIARLMDISPDMALQIAKDLADKGYLQEFEMGCDEHQNACSECAVNAGCQVVGRHWVVTEKGKNAISVRTTVKPEISSV